MIDSPRPVRTAVATAALVVSGTLLAACGDDSPPPPDSVAVEAVPAASVVTETIRYAVSMRPPDGDEVPIVYVVSTGERGFSAGVQADVASALRDDIDVRFADERSEVIDEDAELQPVIDGAALLLLGDVPEEPAPVSVSIEVYYDDADRSRSVFTLDFEPAGGTAPDDSIVWRVTATSFVPLDAPT
jgi:hypothetical protein